MRCDYDDSDEAPNAETLTQRIMSEASKRRINRAIGDHCLIENSSHILEHVHCLKRSTEDHLLDSIEFAWNMKPFTLNVDTRYNVLRLCPDFRKLFVMNLWLFLPETDIIDAYYNAINTRKLPNIDAKVYQYTLIAHENMRGRPIHRRKDITHQPIRADDFTFYSHPYHDFPTIGSHAHPRFIICNSGSKLDESGLLQWRARETRKDDLAKVVAIWNSWKQEVPTGEFVEKTSSEDGDPDTIGDHKSEKTARASEHTS
ncbi:hypothetical protein EDB86DRAFT_510285 [Lactarius hatsudake]|nr:hypothetical protein EDB86DRAFT_510285 [Lactarius hatsudake]